MFIRRGRGTSLITEHPVVARARIMERVKIGLQSAQRSLRAFNPGRFQLEISVDDETAVFADIELAGHSS